MSDELKDFRNFVFMAWDHLGLPDPTPVQYDISQYLQNGPRRRMVQAFRGVGKSWITSVFVLWRLLQDPNQKILVVSASKPRADDFSIFCNRLVTEMPVLQHLAPTESQRNSKVAWDVGPTRAAHAPSVKSVGILGQITGSRADLIVADDVEVPGNSATVGSREKLSQAVREFEAIIVPEQGEIVFLGTPQSEESVYNELPNRGYETKIYPVRMPEDPMIYEGKLANYYTDSDLAPLETVEPSRFSDEELIDREASYGRTGFQLQFQLDVRLSDLNRHPLRLSDLIVDELDADVAPERIVWGTAEHWYDIPMVGFKRDKYYKPKKNVGSMIPYSGSVLAIDPSGRGADETAYAVIKYLNGYLYLLDWGGYTDGFTEPVMKGLASVAKRWKVNEVVTEQNYGGGMFTELLKPHLTDIYPVTTTEVTAKGMKESRICDVLEPVMNQHRLIVDRTALVKDHEDMLKRPPDLALQYSLPYQMSRMARERGCIEHDDKVDAVCMAVSYWTDYMSRNADEAMKERKEELLDAELEKIEDAIGGIIRKSRGPEDRGDKWFSV